MFVGLFTALSSSSDCRRASGAVIADHSDGRAGDVNVTDSCVCKLIQLTTIIKVHNLEIRGTLRYDRTHHGPPDDVTQVNNYLSIFNVENVKNSSSLVGRPTFHGRVTTYIFHSF